MHRETTAFHFHCPAKLGRLLRLEAGDDAANARWLDVNSENPLYVNLYASHKDWVDKVAIELLPHKLAREPYNLYPPRFQVQDQHVPWNYELADYQPPNVSSRLVSNIREDSKESGSVRTSTELAEASLGFNKSAKEKGSSQYTYEAPIKMDPASHLPLNPRGRTGLRGRGDLTFYGPNHRAEPIVTRYDPHSFDLQVRLP